MAPQWYVLPPPLDTMPSRKRGVEGALTTLPRVQAGPAGAQHIGVVDAVATGQRGGHQRHHLVTGVGSACSCMPRSQAPVNQLGQAKRRARVDWKNQPGIGHQAVIVEGDADAVGVAAW